jgi:phage terminase small subunit
VTPKQEAFVREYLVDLNASAAARRAGYSAKHADVNGPRLLGNAGIAAAVAAAQQTRAERTEITADRVLKELARIAFFDIRKLYREDGSLKSPTELDDDTAAALVGIDIQETVTAQEDGPIITTRKAKVIDRTAALTLAMRHLGMLRDRLEVEDITDRAEQMRARQRKRLAEG